jgi:methionyl-tRNA formyltransferase
MISVIFFGSFSEFSALTLQTLLAAPDITIPTVVTSPPRPANRGQLSVNPTQVLAESQSIPVITPTQLKTDLPPLPAADFILVAGYGLLIPPVWLGHPRYFALNAHPSLLPRYPGRFPIEWALLFGESQVGLSIISMNQQFDAGQIALEQPIPVTPADDHLSLYRQIYQLTGQITPRLMSQLIAGSVNLVAQTSSSHFYARGLTRQDGFIPFKTFLAYTHSRPSAQAWPLLSEINSHLASPITSLELIARMHRSLQPWPGLWTTNPAGVRLIVKNLNPLLIQPEGKNPSPWPQIAPYYS